MTKKPAKFSDLDQLYREALDVDRSIRNEQRSNVLLAYGNHFNKTNSRHWGRLRDSVGGDGENDRLRVTKNHIHRITRTIVNSILSQSPDVAPTPKNESELQDQKAAELHNSVWLDIKYTHNFVDKVRKWCEDFVVIGEVALKIYWDPYKGDVIGYKQKMSPDNEPMVDENGEPINSDIPLFSGDICFERIMGFNLLRDPTAKAMDESDCLIYLKMVPTRALKQRYDGDEEKMKFIQESSNDIYTVFDGASGNVTNTKGQTMLREFYYRKCEKYPKGYYYITTENGTLEQGPLPFGIFPIVVAGWDEIQTTPRKRSIIKQLRSTQYELNRTASQISTTHLTVGDTKLLIQNGTKITQGAKYPGVRELKYSGAKPEYFQGQAGEQFFAYYAAQVNEIYQLANIDREEMDKSDGQLDPYSELFRSIKQKKKFSIYAVEFENFLKQVCVKALTVAKYYYDDQKLVPAIGRSEYVNIPEFRAQGDINYQIKVVPQSDDVESKMGKQITLTNTMQYLGSQLTKEDAGRILRAMPYTNLEQAFSDWTTESDMVTNDILALDRGEMPETNLYQDHKYGIKRLTSRVKQADFKLLNAQIQQNYAMKIQEHEDMEAQQLQMLKQSQSQFIPATGPLVKADIYVSDPENPSKTARAKIPMDALSWLIDQLEKQGISLAELQRLDQQNQADISQQFLAGQQAQQQPAMQGQLPAGIPEQGF